MEGAVRKRGVATKLVDGVIRFLSSVGASLVGLGSPAIRLVCVSPHGVLATSLGDVTLHHVGLEDLLDGHAVVFLEGFKQLVGFFVASSNSIDGIVSPLSCTSTPLISHGSPTVVLSWIW